MFIRTIFPRRLPKRVSWSAIVASMARLEVGRPGFEHGGLGGVAVLASWQWNRNLPVALQQNSSNSLFAITATLPAAAAAITTITRR